MRKCLLCNLIGYRVVVFEFTITTAIEGMGEAIGRYNLYLEVGADQVFIDGIDSNVDVEKAVQEINGPLSVNLMDAISGMQTELIPIPESAEMDVAQASIPVANKNLSTFYNAPKFVPEGVLPGHSQWVGSF